MTSITNSKLIRALVLLVAGACAALSQEAQKSLTNLDVIKMVKAGVPESAIVSSIQSSPTRFDLSSDALLALHRAGVGQKVLEAMMADGSVRSRTSISSSPQPGTASSGGGKMGAQLPLKIKLGLPKTGLRVKNPRASQRDSAIIAVLQKQRQTADLEFAGMRTEPGIGAADSAAVRSQGAPQSTATLLRPSENLKAIAPTRLSPEHTESETLSSMGRVSATKVSACPFVSSGMGIAAVVGAQHGVILSAEPQYNLYTVTGCNLGNSSPGNKAWIYGANLHVDLQIQQWSQTQVAFMFTPQLTGVADQNNVHLVLHRSDGQEVDTTGYKFYAARDTVLLSIPGPTPTPVFSGDPSGRFQLQYSSPAPDSAGYFAEVARWNRAQWDRPSGNVSVNGQPVGRAECNDCKGFGIASVNINSGTDHFDFSKMVAGFTTESFQMLYWQPDAGSLCGGNGDTLAHTHGALGSWSAAWDGDNIQVTWGDAYCHELELFAGTEVRQSQYALQVWVTGPRGIDPWTGKPN